MRLREVNVNTAPPQTKPLHEAEATVKKSITATYISPPRNSSVQVAPSHSASTTAATVPTRHLPHHHHHMHQREGVYAPAMSPVAAGSPIHSTSLTQMHYVESQQPHPMCCHAAAALQSALSECPCEPCSFYRHYLHLQAAAAAAGAGPYSMHTFMEEELTLRSISAVPVMSLNGRKASVVGPAASLAPTQPHHVPVVEVAPSPYRDTANCLEEFQARCPGKVIEMSCSAEGKSLVQFAVRTQNLAVLEIVVSEISSDIGTVALDANGCHVLRAVVETCSSAQAELLVGSMHETLILNICTVSQYTRRVIQALFERHAAPVDLSGVRDVLSRNALYLAATQQGCISLMRVYKACSEEAKASLLERLLPQFASIAFDPYGNYVVQCAMESTDCTVAAQYVVSCFGGRLLDMSCDKFASNVVEKIIRCCGHVPGVRRILLDELVYNPASLQEVARDGFGNFVLQSVLECVTQHVELKRVADRLRPALQRSPFAAKIECRIRAKRLPITEYLYPAAMVTAPSPMQMQPSLITPPAHVNPNAVVVAQPLSAGVHTSNGTHGPSQGRHHGRRGQEHSRVPAASTQPATQPSAQ